MKFKIIINLILILLLTFNVVFAGDPFAIYSGASVNSSEIDEIGNKVIGIINVGGTVISICVLMFIGIKFMIAAPDEKANLKGALAPYVLGAVLLLASTNIVQIIYDFSTNNI